MKNPRIKEWLEKVELGLYRRATRIVTVTESFRQNISSRNVPVGKVVTIPNGADIDFWSPREGRPELRHQLGLNGATVVLYLGTHGISHGLRSVLTAADQLRNLNDIQFVFVGEGSEKRDLVEQASTLQLGNVRFIDSVNKDQARDYYALADVCLVPLRNIKLFEGFIPSKIFEIMAMGRPIVGAVRGETAEILRRSGSSLIVEPEDPASIASAVVNLHFDPDQRRSKGESGRRFVVEQYGRRKLAQAYVRVLEEAIQEARRR